MENEMTKEKIKIEKTGNCIARKNRPGMVSEWKFVLPSGDICSGFQSRYAAQKAAKEMGLK